MKSSAKLVETALDLGIRYFDVAPSYGIGTAEEVLGKVIGDSPEVVIATKCGIPRPAYNPKKMAIRRFIKTSLLHAPLIKGFLLRLLTSKTLPGETTVRHNFSSVRLQESLEESLRFLRRQRVDVFLAHEPSSEDLSIEVAEGFENLVNLGLAECYGAGVGMASRPFNSFGKVWQSCWPGDAAVQYCDDTTYVFHGALRYFDREYAPVRTADIGKRISQLARLSPRSVLLVSASTPRRLREIVAAAREYGGSDI